MQTVTLRGATPQDIPAIESLLTGFDLPTVGIADHIEDFLVAEDGGRMVASAGIEVYGTAALLRSVAVNPAYRGRGLARTLVEQLLDRARRAGVHHAFLLTSTAADYFARLDFIPISDADVDPGVRASKEFESCCCAGAHAMWLRLGGAT